MKRSLLITLLLACALLALAACSSSTPAPAPTATTAPTPTQPPTPTLAPPQPPDATAAALLAAGTPLPTRVNPLPPVAEGALNSYIAHMTADEVPAPGSTPAATAATPAATQGGTPEPTGAPYSVELRYTKQPAPGVYQMTVSGDLNGATGLATGQQFKLITSGNDTYLFVQEQNKWARMPNGSSAMPSTEQLVDPNVLAANLPEGIFTPANVVSAHETVDGVDTTHYKAGEAQVKQMLGATSDPTQSVVDVKADFWVANTGGYMKQYVLQATLANASGQKILQTVRVSITDENKPLTIATPAPDQLTTIPGLEPGTAVPTP